MFKSYLIRFFFIVSYQSKMCLFLFKVIITRGFRIIHNLFFCCSWISRSFEFKIYYQRTLNFLLIFIMCESPLSTIMNRFSSSSLSFSTLEDSSTFFDLRASFFIECMTLLSPSLSRVNSGVASFQRRSFKGNLRRFCVFLITRLKDPIWNEEDTLESFLVFH